MLSTAKLQKRIDAAQGRADSDILLKNVRFLDVFSSAWKTGDVAVSDGVIVGLESGLKAKRVIDGRGKWLVPGFIDAHVHVESSLLTPDHFQRAILPKGTTTAVCDPHELANVLGTPGIQYFLDASERLSQGGGLALWVMLSSCVPATHMETNGGGTIGAAELVALAGHPRALGLAEMMNMPGVLHGEPEVLKKLEAFSESPIDGHCPLLRGAALSAYAATGISSCHESSELEEAREKLTKGIAVWIREGSVAKDLKTLIPLLTIETSTSVGFCTDDRNPYDIATEGHIDYLIRSAISSGVSPEVAYRAASYSVARHYGLDRGASRCGAIAPGYAGDLVLLGDAKTCAIESVFKEGRLAEEVIADIAAPSLQFTNSVRASVPSTADLQGPEGRVHVIEVIEGKIITGRSVRSSSDPEVCRLSVLERYGRSSNAKPANGYAAGFGALQGAIASSVGHDSHNLIVVGGNLEDMRTALAALIESGGGFCVAQKGGVLERLPLPWGGLMSADSAVNLKNGIVKLKAASNAIGCRLPEPFLQLAFLSLPVIPSLKLTDRGLVDVDLFKIIDVRAS